MTFPVFFSLLVRSLPRARVGALRAGAVLLAGVAALLAAASASAQAYDAPIATLVTNMDQPSGARSVVLSDNQDGLGQGFRTGSDRGGYEPHGRSRATADGTATAGQDYVSSSGTLTFADGETAHTIEVTVLDDAHDEGEETFALHLSNAVGAEIEDAEATGTIVNSDAMPRAWLGRVGRAAWEHALDAVDRRLRSAGNPATRTVIAGHEMTAAGADPVSDKQEIAALAAWIDNGTKDPLARTMSAQELLAASEFQVATAASDDGPVLTVWGQSAYGHFAGRNGDLAIDGEVATGTLGADYATGRWMADWRCRTAPAGAATRSR